MTATLPPFKQQLYQPPYPIDLCYFAGTQRLFVYIGDKDIIAEPAVIILPMVEPSVPISFCFSDTRFCLLGTQGNEDDPHQQLFFFANHYGFIHHSAAALRWQ